MRYVTLFILSLMLWLMLTFRLTPPNLAVGAAVSLITALIFGKYFFRNVYKFLEPHRYFWLLIYFFVFLWACLKANLDVAYRVLHPAMPIKPGIVKVKTTLKSEFARTILANSITMTPGTISVDLVDDFLYIHWIYVHAEEEEIYSSLILGQFEKYIKKILE
jgi:multicomponent Na+:H+ antiporter subunit E